MQYLSLQARLLESMDLKMNSIHQKSKRLANTQNVAVVVPSSRAARQSSHELDQSTAVIIVLDQGIMYYFPAILLVKHIRQFIPFQDMLFLLLAGSTTKTIYWR
jgi:hypothetical protein